MKRILRITTQDDAMINLNITKAVSIKSPKKMFTLEELNNGTYRLLWSESLVKNFSDIKSLEIIRGDRE